MCAVGESLAFFLTPLGTLLLTLVFGCQTGEGFAYLLLYVLFVDLGVDGTFVAVTVAASAFATLAIVAATAVVTASVIVSTTLVIAVTTFAALIYGLFDVYFSTDATTLLRSPPCEAFPPAF